VASSFILPLWSERRTVFTSLWDEKFPVIERLRSLHLWASALNNYWTFKTGSKSAEADANGFIGAIPLFPLFFFDAAAAFLKIVPS